MLAAVERASAGERKKRNAAWRKGEGRGNLGNGMREERGGWLLFIGAEGHRWSISGARDLRRPVRDPVNRCAKKGVEEEDAHVGAKKKEDMRWHWELARWPWRTGSGKKKRRGKERAGAWGPDGSETERGRERERRLTGGVQLAER